MDKIKNTLRHLFSNVDSDLKDLKELYEDNERKKIIKMIQDRLKMLNKRFESAKENYEELKGEGKDLSLARHYKVIDEMIIKELNFLLKRLNGGKI